MKVLHIAASDFGGAGNSVRRIHEELLNKNFDSKLLVLHKFSNVGEIYEYELNFFQKYYNLLQRAVKKILFKFYYKRKKEQDFFSNYKIGFDLSKNKLVKEADIIHFHWVAEYLDYSFFNKIKNKKIIWTIRDMNPFTGGCHYLSNCDKYKKQCGKCPQLNSNNENDLSKKAWNYKNNNYSKKIQLIVLSNWQKNFLLKSSLFKNFNVKVVSPGMPNLKKINKNKARKHFGLPKNKFLILFGSFDETKSKGGEYFEKTIDHLSNFKKDIELVSFGKTMHREFKLKKHDVGFLKTNEELSLVYSAVDLTIMPSKEEAFGKIFSESMLCGTPSICFNVGGPKDLIENGKNGFLLKVGDSKGVAEKIILLYKDKKLLNSFSKNCRNKILKNHLISNEVNNYIKIYKNLIGEQND
jgi:glycosyltransferase involved in cell wall biosynthesis